VPRHLFDGPSLAHRTQTFPWPDFKKVPLINRAIPTDKDLKDGYIRFKDSEDGVSPMAIPHGRRLLRRDGPGIPNAEPQLYAQVHIKMSAKRARKIEVASKEKGFTARYGPPKAKIGIIGWGSTQGAIREGVDLAATSRYPGSPSAVKMVYPLPEPTSRNS